MTECDIFIPTLSSVESSGDSKYYTCENCGDWRLAHSNAAEERGRAFMLNAAHALLKLRERV